MTPALMLHLIVRPSLRQLCPPTWCSPDAERFLIAIAGQESNLEHRDQLDGTGKPGAIGPACGLYQFEKAGLQGVERHPATKALLAEVAKQLCLPIEFTGRWVALVYCDAWSTVCARALIKTLPQALPTTAEQGWAQYLDGWRPGKPRPQHWERHWIAASNAVMGDAA